MNNIDRKARSATIMLLVYVIWNAVDISHLQRNVNKLHHQVKQLQGIINEDSN